MNEDHGACPVGREAEQVHQVCRPAEDQVDLEVAHAGVDLHRHAVLGAELQRPAEQVIAQLLHRAATETTLDRVQRLEALVRRPAQRRDVETCPVSNDGLDPNVAAGRQRVRDRVVERLAEL